MRTVNTTAEGSKFVAFAKKINKSDSVRRAVDMALMSDKAENAARMLNCRTLAGILGETFKVYRAYNGGYKVSAGNGDGYICFSVRF